MPKQPSKGDSSDESGRKRIRRYVKEGAATNTDPRNIAFARNLNTLMLSKGWKQTDLANEAEKHLPRAYILKSKKEKRARGSQTNEVFGRWNISNYIRGKSMPENIRIEALARALDVTIEQLVPPNSADILGGPYMYMTAGAAPNHMRVHIDMELPTAIALKIVELVNGDS